MTKRAPNLLIVLLMAAAAAGAQNAPASGVTQDANGQTSETDVRDTSSPLLAPRPSETLPQPPVDSDGVTRSVSPGVAAALSAALPKYNPPKPTPTPTGTPVDMREVDKPKNEIRRLPKYVVQERRPPVFRDRDLFTADGLADLSFKLHPGLNIGNFLGLNSGIAAQMYYDDQRLENMKDLADTARAMAAGGDAAEGKEILQLSQETYLRGSDDFGPTGAAGSNTGGWGK